MQAPDFAVCGPQGFAAKDLLFLFEHFPVPGVDVEEAVRRVHEQPSTLESIFESRYLFEAMTAKDGRWLDISPKLYFNIMLRHHLKEKRDALDRQVIHYLANLLGIYSSPERLHSIQQGEAERFDYLIDLVAAGVASESDLERRFLVDAQIANYALYLSGMCAPWIEHRRRYRHRPLSVDYYTQMSRSHYATAAYADQARTFGLRQVFRRLAQRFEYFRSGVQQLRAELFPQQGLA